MVIFPLAPDQTIAQMWSNGARGVSSISIFSVISMHQICQTGWIHDLAGTFWARIKFSLVPGFRDLL